MSADGKGGRRPPFELGDLGSHFDEARRSLEAVGAGVQAELDKAFALGKEAGWDACADRMEDYPLGKVTETAFMLGFAASREGFNGARQFDNCAPAHLLSNSEIEAIALANPRLRDLFAAAKRQLKLDLAAAEAE